MASRHATVMIDGDTFGRCWAICQCGWESAKTRNPTEAKLAYERHRGTTDGE